MNTPRYCEHCGHILEPNNQFCENCGNRIVTIPTPPSAVQQQVRAPIPARPAAKKSGLPAWLIPVGIGCLTLFCCGVLIMLGFLYLRTQDSGSEEAVQPVFATPLPATPEISMPTVQAPESETIVPLTPTDTSQPEEPAVPPTPTDTLPTEDEAPPPTTEDISTQQNFTRWVLDYSLQWELGENDIYITDINQDQSWIIGLKQPQNIVMVIPPHPLAYYPNNASITVKVQPGDYGTSGSYGVICHFQDENNYYLVEIQGDNYGIGKMVNGRFTPLTESYWQPSQFIGDRDSNGFIELGVTCVDYSVGVSINGFGESFPVYDPSESFSGGAAALFGASSPQAVDMLMGIFYFKDMTIENIE